MTYPKSKKIIIARQLKEMGHSDLANEFLEREFPNDIFLKFDS